MLAVPLVGCAAEWVERCQYTGGLAYDRGCYGVSGSLVYEKNRSVDALLIPSLDGRVRVVLAFARPVVRFAPDRAVRYDDADEVYGEVAAGPGPRLQLTAYGEKMIVDDDLVGCMLYGRFLGKCYRVHCAARALQRRWRRGRAFARAADGKLPPDVIRKILATRPA